MSLEEYYRQDVLTSEFFLDDKWLLGEVAVAPDPAGRAAFFAADQRARDLSQLRALCDVAGPRAAGRLCRAD
jgi:hypothetical protein